MVQAKSSCQVWGIVAVLLAAGGGEAELLTFASPADWNSWQIPQGLAQFDERGYLQLVKYRKNINAVSDAQLFSHPTQKRGEVRGGIWQAGSNSATAPLIIDGDPATFWQPVPDDAVENWTVEIDLGRAVLAEEIRLTFPDREGARPFSQFSVFVATGARIQGTDDVFKYELAYRTTRPNKEALVWFSIGGERDTTRVVERRPDVDLENESHHRTVQYILIEVDEKSAAAALAEVEVISAGDNVSIGTLARGGFFSNGVLAQQPQNMFDGIMDTNGAIVTVTYGGRDLRGWLESGVWWAVDLGALFWIDEIYLYNKEQGEGLSSFQNDFLNSGTGFQILFSDGARTISGDIDYTPLILEPRWQSDHERTRLQFRYLFQPRKIRYLFFHALADEGWYTQPMEFMLFSQGHPAQVALRSNFIDLGKVRGEGQAKAIKALFWDAELPPGTRLQLRSRSGNELGEVYTFHNKAGEVVTETQWNSLPKAVRGATDTTVVVGNDWGEWSNVYQFSGETFKSESPRRFIQLEAIQSTEDFHVAPVVRSLSIEFEDALVREAKGRLSPRQTRANADTRFRYTVWPRAAGEDSGFDLLRLVIPSPVAEDSVVVQVGGRLVAPRAIAMRGDSLLITLPEPVSRDSVEVEFTARFLRNATVVSLDLGHSGRPGLWQSVEAAERQANVVFLPDLASRRRLIGDLEIAPHVLTPNGDGLNEAVEIRFAIFKVERPQAQVLIFDLAGRLVAELPPDAGRDVQVFRWSGRNQGGELVEPGIYLCHIAVGAKAGKDVAIEPIAVAY